MDTEGTEDTERTGDAGDAGHIRDVRDAGDAGDAGDGPVRMTAWVHGRVQGVGFRWWVRARARELGLVGSAANLPDGRVEVVVEGPRQACEDLLEALNGPDPPGRVRSVVTRWGQSRGGMVGFVER